MHKMMYKKEELYLTTRNSIYYFGELKLSGVTLINYTTRDFISKAELELYISKQDNIFTENVISEFKKSGNG